MTDFTLIARRLARELPLLEIKENEPMREHCSFKVGGPAALMLIPHTRRELEHIMDLMAIERAPVLILGRGTNILPPDEGLRAVVIKTGGLDELRLAAPTSIEAMCGVSLTRLATFAMELGLSGLEFAHGIPGSVGGGALMNAGAYGGALSNAIARTVYLRANGARLTYNGMKQGFGYRTSAFASMNGVIVSCRFELIPGDKELIRAKVDELAQKRRASQPLELPSAGSAFKRPADGYAAALIEQAGLKGFSVGGAQVSTKHSGFVVNTGGATASDIRAVMSYVRETVLRVSGVELEPEIRVLSKEGSLCSLY